MMTFQRKWRASLVIFVANVLVIGVALAISNSEGQAATVALYGTQQPPRCTSGVVSLGAHPGAIDFAASCQASAWGGVVQFQILRYSARRPHSGPGIVKFSRRPRLRGPGAQGRYGACVFRRTVLGCHAHATGMVKIWGRMWVARGTRCSKRVLLETIRSVGCKKEECLGSLPIKILARGRPDGC
jgi:hypothetical protein